MCGIAGLFQLQAPVDRDELGRFTDALAHRGPDGRGLLRDGIVGLGYRHREVFKPGGRQRGPVPFEDSQLLPWSRRWQGRLAALASGNDTDASLQPYRYWITYDGEIYNFPELQRELTAMGYHFQGRSDAEVVLAAYAQWGEACLTRFNGNWAFALWDRQERSLFLARDRFGAKPLYYRQAGGRFAFASELKAFFALRDFSPSVDEDAVPALFQNAELAESAGVDTPMAGIKRVPAGHTLRLGTDGILHMRRWWDSRRHLPAAPARYEDQVIRLRELFADAVYLRLRSDVSIGLWIGEDVGSRATAAVAAQARRERLTLTRAAPDWRYALIRQSAHQEIGEAFPEFRLHRAQEESMSLEQAVIAAAWSREEIGGGHGAESWRLYHEWKRHGPPVILDGRGADALFGGGVLQFDWLMGHANEQLHHDFHLGRWPAQWRDRDRAAMAHGLQVRTPFLDWRLVAFAEALPASSKFGEGKTQRVLRDALTALLPDRSAARDVAAESSRDAGWAEPSLRPLAAKLATRSRWFDSAHWDGRSQRKLLLSSDDGSRTAPEFSRELTIALNLTLWEALFVERLGARDLSP